MSANPFRASPGSITKLVAASSSTSIAATAVCTGGENGLLLSNPSTVAIYASIGSSLVSASQPTTSLAGGICIPPSGVKAFLVPGTPTYGWVSAVTSAGSAAPGLFATPGYGL